MHEQYESGNNFASVAHKIVNNIQERIDKQKTALIKIEIQILINFGAPNLSQNNIVLKSTKITGFALFRSVFKSSQTALLKIIIITVKSLHVQFLKIQSLNIFGLLSSFMHLIITIFRNNHFLVRI